MYGQMTAAGWFYIGTQGILGFTYETFRAVAEAHFAGTLAGKRVLTAGLGALGDGGTCYGDSGGPNFLGAGSSETNIVAATTITGDFMCRATNVVYRMDTPSARAFLGQFVTLP
jgi:hypothetical protein